MSLSSTPGSTRLSRTLRPRLRGGDDIRKNLLEYDDVMNLQRKALYGLRDEILTGTGVDEKVVKAIEDVVEKYTDDHFPQGCITKTSMSMPGKLRSITSPSRSISLR